MSSTPFDDIMSTGFSTGESADPAAAAVLPSNARVVPPSLKPTREEPADEDEKPKKTTRKRKTRAKKETTVDTSPSPKFDASILFRRNYNLGVVFNEISQVGSLVPQSEDECDTVLKHLNAALAQLQHEIALVEQDKASF